MTPDPYDHVREAFHTVADGLMEWEDPPERAVSDPQPLRAYYLDEDVDTLERAGESLMRLQDETNAIRLFALALRIRQALHP